MGTPPLLPQGCQRMVPGLPLWNPTLAGLSPNPTYITAGPTVPAGGQAFLLNFQELLGSVQGWGGVVIHL